MFDGEANLPSYNRAIVELMQADVNRFFGTTSIRVLDFGAGLGSLAKLWLATRKDELVCLEIDPGMRKGLVKNGFTLLEIGRQSSASFDVVYSSNVLEHIEDDSKSIRDQAKLLNKGGLLIAYVPALTWLFSDLDRRVGHYRRYSKRDLLRLAGEAQLELITVRYVDSIGFLASLYLKYFGFRSGKLSAGGPRSLRFYDRYIFPISQRFDRISGGALIGKNLLLICRKN